MGRGWGKYVVLPHFYKSTYFYLVVIIVCIFVYFYLGLLPIF